MLLSVMLGTGTQVVTMTSITLGKICLNLQCIESTISFAKIKEIDCISNMSQPRNHNI
jgi:hypothetical protein